MNTKLQELTEKLYNEGLTKGQQEADNVLKQAKTEAESIIANAKIKAEEIEKLAKKQAEETKANANIEIKLAGRQTISEVKNSVENLILTKIVSADVKSTFDNKAFVKELIKTATENFSPSNANNTNLFMIVPENQKQELLQYIETNVSKELSSTIEVKEDGRLKSGFKIGSKTDGYYISFTDEDFDNLFKAYLRPKVSSLLFGE